MIQFLNNRGRIGVLIACEIAGLNCLKIINESTAIALGYGIFKSAKKLFSETDPTFVMFVDIGYTQFTASIVEFRQVIVFLPISQAGVAKVI